MIVTRVLLLPKEGQELQVYLFEIKRVLVYLGTRNIRAGGWKFIIYKEGFGM